MDNSKDKFVYNDEFCNRVNCDVCGGYETEDWATNFQLANEGKEYVEICDNCMLDVVKWVIKKFKEDTA